MTTFLKKYAFIALALVAGVIIVAPSIYFHFVDPAYRGAEMFGSDAEDFYLAQVREIYDGHYHLGNVYYADLKNVPYVQQSLSPMIEAAAGIIFRVPLPWVNIAAKFVFPFLAVCIIYLFWLTLTKRRAVSLTMTAFIIFIPATTVFLDPHGWTQFFLHRVFSRADLQFLSFARPINPQISALFVYGFLLCAYKFIFANASNRWGLSAAVLLGLSFYTYFFAFTLIWAVTAVLLIWFLIGREWQRFWRLLTVAIFAALIGIPYILNVWNVLQDPIHTQTAYHLGMLDGHKFIFSRVWWGVTILFLLFYRRADHFRTFILGVMAAFFIVTNQQLITGATVPIPAHYHWYYVAPIGGALLLFLVIRFLERHLSSTNGRRWVLRGAQSAVMIFFIVSGVLFQKLSYFAQRPGIVAQQRYMDVVRWADTRVKEDAVWFGNYHINTLIPVYTRHDVYSHGGAGDYLVSNDRLAHAYYLYLLLDDVPVSALRSYLRDPVHRDDAGRWLFSQKYRVMNGCYGCFPDEVAESIAVGYEKFYLQNFITELRRYRVDYIVWDRNNDPAWRMDRFFKDAVYDADGIVVFKVNGASGASI